MANCQSEACERPAIARGMCRRHYGRQYQRPDQPACSAPDCDRPNLARGLCQLHYSRDRPARVERNPRPAGPPAPRPRSARCVDMAGQRFGTLTVTAERRGKFWVCVCDCGRTRLVRRRELVRYGDRNTCGHWPTHHRADVVSYGGAHDRLDRDHGLAKTHQCVDCNGPAAHWSYDHADPDELTSPEGYPYSLDAGHYQPRCSSCHARFDAARKRPHFFGAR